MPTTVVRAEDSAQAMDEVIARLGPDALILSTVKRNGMVEITATTDPVPPKEAVEVATRPAPETPTATAQIVPLPQVEPAKVSVGPAASQDAPKAGSVSHRVRAWDLLLIAQRRRTTFWPRMPPVVALEISLM